jgi:hypothetical protein
LRSDLAAGSLACLAILALSIATGRSEGQQPGDETAPGADRVQDGCASVVLVQCAQAEQRDQVDAPVDARESARRRLQSRRLQQMQAQAGLNAIEITGERPARVQSDTWEDFRQSVARTAVPDCLSRDNFPPEQWGLLRPLMLAGSAVAGKCR